MDVKQMAIGAIEKLVASGQIEMAIDEAVGKTVLNAIKEQLGRYSDFDKQIQEAVKKSLALKAELDLPTYNQAILKIVEAQLEGATHAVIQQQVAARLKDLLKPPPESIRLTQLVEQYIEHLKDHRRAGCVCHGESQRITLKVEGDRDEFKTVYLDDEPDKPRMECKIRIGLHGQEIYVLQIQGQGKLNERMFAGPLYGFERSLFQMRVAGTKLVLDCDPEDVQTEWELAEQY